MERTFKVSKESQVVLNAMVDLTKDYECFVDGVSATVDPLMLDNEIEPMTTKFNELMGMFRERLFANVMDNLSRIKNIQGNEVMV